VCQAGKYGTSSVTSLCTVCGANTYSDSGATTCTDCPAGKWISDDGSYYGNHDSSYDCDSCSAGKYLSESSCVVCGANTYSDSGATTCTDCPAGKWISDDGSYYGNHDSSSDCQGCSAGKYLESSLESSCVVCGANTYSDYGATTCTDCPAGKHISDDGTYSSNHDSSSDCSSCSSGTYSAGGSGCKICPSGFYSDRAAGSCTQCPNGKSIKDDGETQDLHDDIADCELFCPAGKYKTDSDNCKVCEGNMYSNDGDSVCKECPIGKYTKDDFDFDDDDGKYDEDDEDNEDNRIAKHHSSEGACFGHDDHGAIILGATLGIVAAIWFLYHLSFYLWKRAARARMKPPLESSNSTSTVANPLAPSDIELVKKSSSVSKEDGDDAIGGHIEAALEKSMKSEGADAKDLVGGASAVHRWMSGGGSGGFWSMSYIVINFVQNFTLVSLFDVEWPLSWSLSISWLNFSYFDVTIVLPTIMESDPELAKWLSFLVPLFFHPLLIARFDNGLFRRMDKTRSERIRKQVGSKEAWTGYKKTIFPMLFVPLTIFTIVGIVFAFLSNDDNNDDDYNDDVYVSGNVTSVVCLGFVALLMIFAFIKHLYLKDKNDRYVYRNWGDSPAAPVFIYAVYHILTATPVALAVDGYDDPSTSMIMYIIMSVILGSGGLCVMANDKRNDEDLCTILFNPLSLVPILFVLCFLLPIQILLTDSYNYNDDDYYHNGYNYHYDDDDYYGTNDALWGLQVFVATLPSALFCVYSIYTVISDSDRTWGKFFKVFSQVLIFLAMNTIYPAILALVTSGMSLGAFLMLTLLFVSVSQYTVVEGRRVATLSDDDMYADDGNPLIPLPPSVVSLVLVSILSLLMTAIVTIAVPQIAAPLLLGIGGVWLVVFGIFVVMHKVGLRSLHVRCEAAVGKDESMNTSFGSDAPTAEYGDDDDGEAKHRNSSVESLKAKIAQRKKKANMKRNDASGSKSAAIEREFNNKREKLEFGIFMFMYLISYLSGVNAVVSAMAEGGGLGITAMCLSPFYVLAPLIKLAQVARDMYKGVCRNIGKGGLTDYQASLEDKINGNIELSQTEDYSEEEEARRLFEQALTSALLGPYEQKYWWFKVFLLTEKACLAFIALYLGSTPTGIWAGVGLTAFGCLVSIITRPYWDDAEDMCDILARVSTLITIFVGGLIKTGIVETGNRFVQFSLFGVTLLSFIVLVMTLGPTRVFNALKTWVTAKRAGSKTSSEEGFATMTSFEAGTFSAPDVKEFTAPQQMWFLKHHPRVAAKLLADVGKDRFVTSLGEAHVTKSNTLKITTPLEPDQIAAAIAVFGCSENLKKLDLGSNIVSGSSLDKLIESIVLKYEDDPDKRIEVEFDASQASKFKRAMIDVLIKGSTCIKLNNERMSKPGVDLLAGAARCAKGLTHFEVTGSKITDDSAAMIASIIKNQSSTLVDFNISDNSLTDIGMNKLFDAICSKEDGEKINFKFNGNDGVKFEYWETVIGLQQDKKVDFKMERAKYLEISEESTVTVKDVVEVDEDSGKGEGGEP